MRDSSVTQILGKWTTDPDDVDSILAYEQTILEFNKDGRLIYTIHRQKSDQIMILTYEVKNGVLITNQPSAPREERTKFEFTDEGKLRLEFAGTVSTYIRMSASTEN